MTAIPRATARPARRDWRRRLKPVVAALTGLVAFGVWSAPAANASPTVVLVGHGWGHGGGMSAWGMYGYVVDQGWTSDMVLDHYYGGTTSGSIGDIPMSVALLNVSGGTWLTSGGGFTVGDPNQPGGRQHVDGGSAAQLVWTGAGWQVYTRYNGCGGTGSYGPYPVAGATVWLDADPGPSGKATQLLTTCATGTAYRGSLRGVWTGSAVRIVNDLPMEQYLRSVMPSEYVASWADARGGWGAQALRAAAVATRSYAASLNKYPYAKSCDTDLCQVYRGAFRNGAAVEDARTDAALVATPGVVRRTASGGVAQTVFSASSGGWTAAGWGFPSVEDQGDVRAPDHTWVAQLDGAAIAGTYGVGTFQRLLVTQQQPGGPGGGRVQQVTVVGSAKTVTVTGAAFRSTWGLKSDWFFPASQPAQQVDSQSYVKLRWGDTVYRQFCLVNNGWCDHAPMTYAEYAAAGFPALSTAPTEFVKYPWSPTLYAVTYWPNEPAYQWKQLTAAEWAKAGYPAYRNAGFIYGTMFYTLGAAPTVYANGPDNVVHALTYDEWRAAGFPWPVRRP